MATVEQVKNVTRRMSEEKATMLAREAVELSRAGYKDVSLFASHVNSKLLLRGHRLSDAFSESDSLCRKPPGD
jgi:hypothetical protein